ncbi:MAG: hypothetical protein ABI563_08920 [Specibacter sp.]
MLSGLLVACAVSTLVCYFMCFRNQMTFGFASIKDRIGDVDNREEANHGTPGTLLEKKAWEISMTPFFQPCMCGFGRPLI